MRKTYTIPRGSKYYDLYTVGFIIFAILFLILWVKSDHKNTKENDAAEIRTHVETLVSGEPEEWYELLHSIAEDRIKFLNEYRRILKRDDKLPSGEVGEVTITSCHFDNQYGQYKFASIKNIEADVLVGDVMYHVTESYVVSDTSGTGIISFSIEPKGETTEL